MAKKRLEEQVQEKWLDVDATMHGTLAFKDSVNLRINGRFEGKLSTKGKLAIGENAVVNAQIDGENISVSGKINGNIFASNSLRIIKPAVIKGDIKTPVLVISEGAILQGNCQMIFGDEIGIKEAAQYLEVDADSVIEWAEKGSLPGQKLGGKWSFNKEELDRWVARERVE